MSNNKLLYAGQYTVDALEIIQPDGGIALDIRNQMHQLTIYEDIFSPYISGNVVIDDTYDLPNLMLNAGKDLLRVSFFTPSIQASDRIEKYFHIHKISDREIVGDRRLTYMIHFVSIESLVDTTKTVSKTFKDTPQGIVKKILTEELNSKTPFDSGTAKNSLQFTANLWNPVKAINYAASHAVGEDGYPSFLFYENRKGYQFKQLTQLSKQDNYAIFTTSDHVADVVSKGAGLGDVSVDLKKDYRQITSIEQKVYYDYYRDHKSGMFNSRIQYYDLVTKKLKDNTFNLNSDKHERLNKNKFYKEAIIDTSYADKGSVLVRGLAHTGAFGDKKEYSDVTYKQSRASIMRLYQQHSIVINVFGRTDYTVGMKVYVGANKMRRIDKTTTEKQLTDNYVTGYYIVSAVNHMFIHNGHHECRLELITDSISEGER